MTYLSYDLDRICKNWCPIIGQCPEGHYCTYMDKIRKNIIKLSDFKEFNRE